MTHTSANIVLGQPTDDATDFAVSDSRDVVSHHDRIGQETGIAPNVGGKRHIESAGWSESREIAGDHCDNRLRKTDVEIVRLYDNGGAKFGGAEIRNEGRVRGRRPLG